LFPGNNLIVGCLQHDLNPVSKINIVKLQNIVIEFAIATSYKIVGYDRHVLYKICRHRGRHQTAATTDSSSNLHLTRPQARREGNRAARRWRSLRVSGAYAPVEEPARRWRSPCTGGSVSSVEEPTRRWSRAIGGGSRSSVEEPVRRWILFTGGGAHTPVELCVDGGAHSSVEPRAGGGARSLVLGWLAARGCRWRWHGTLDRRWPIYRLDRD
jgi:hypothetical protein